MQTRREAKKKRSASKDHPPVCGWTICLESTALLKELMKDTKAPFVTVAVYWAVSKPPLWFMQENPWEWWRRGKRKSSLNFWCQSFYAFLSAPVFWLPLVKFFGYPRCFFPLSPALKALHPPALPCPASALSSHLLSLLSLFWLPSTSMIDASLKRMAIYWFFLLNTFSHDPTCPAELRCHLILSSMGHYFSKNQYAPWRLIQFILH